MFHFLRRKCLLNSEQKTLFGSWRVAKCACDLRPCFLLFLLFPLQIDFLEQAGGCHVACITVRGCTMGMIGTGKGISFLKSRLPTLQGFQLYTAGGDFFLRGGHVLFFILFLFFYLRFLHKLTRSFCVNVCITVLRLNDEWLFYWFSFHSRTTWCWVGSKGRTSQDCANSFQWEIWYVYFTNIHRASMTSWALHTCDHTCTLVHIHERVPVFARDHRRCSCLAWPYVSLSVIFFVDQTEFVTLSSLKGVCLSYFDECVFWTEVCSRNTVAYKCLAGRPYKPIQPLLANKPWLWTLSLSLFKKKKKKKKQA